MRFEPDIIVKNAAEPYASLDVEAKTHVPNLGETEARLKEYMVIMHVPIGALITPDRLRLYRDFYTTPVGDSVRRIGDYSITALWRQSPPAEPARFEAFVQRWLEDLPKHRAAVFTKELNNALREYVLPAIESSDIQAAHPRNL